MHWRNLGNEQLKKMAQNSSSTKTKKERCGVTHFRNVTRKSTVNRIRLLCLPHRYISCDLESSFSSWYQEGDSLTNRGFLNVNFPYKRVITSLFSEFIQCVLFLKIVSSKYYLCQKSIFWEGIFCSLMPSVGQKPVYKLRAQE